MNNLVIVVRLISYKNNSKIFNLCLYQAFVQMKKEKK